MGKFIGLIGLVVLMLCRPTLASAAAADADVTYVITNGGVDVKSEGQVHFVSHGNHDGPTVNWTNSGEPVQIPAGNYDVHVTFADGSATKDFWLDNQSFSGKVRKNIEINLPVTEVSYLITNGGTDTKGNGQVHFYQPGHHDGEVVGWSNSGEPLRMPAGSYDVHVTFSDGSVAKDLWLDNQSFSGKVQKTVEIGVNITEVSYLITNGGADTKNKGQVHYYQPGHHSGEVVAWANSDEPVRIPAGSYDVHVTFMDGSATKDMWLDNQSFSGNVRKTVEIGMSVAEVSYVITNGGADTKANGQVHYYPHGHHDGAVVDWASSGGSVKIPAAAYDVAVTYREGLINKQIWLDNQNFSGQVKRTVEMNVIATEPVVAVTQNGVNVGDKATIDYYDQTGLNGLGSVRSTQPALLEQGTYNIRATLDGAEGWLHKVALSGKPHLTIAVSKPVVETLQASGPPPKACTIEVYGVNFDFNKSVLRPDSTPMLRQILLLFSKTPAYSAEISGHTDNVGTPGYNLKLSDARAAAVRAWLLQQGVAATRLTSRGYGDTRPLVPNTTDENRFKNRRVELRRANCQ